MLARPTNSRQRERGGSRRRWRHCLLPWLLAAMPAAVPVLAAASEPAARLQVGSVSLQHCGTPARWCGYLSRPLDPGGAVPGAIDVYFEYYPHTAPAPAQGTLVAAEGGPGSPTTGSRDDYLTLFAPLRETHDVLLMDDRGTGRSGAIDCEPLQRAPTLTAADIGACGRSLGVRAPLYSTNLAADDLAAVLAALGISRIDLYGDSTGTYFAQVFALRHADRLRSLVLDGAYALEGADYAWYPHYGAAMRAKFDLACERSPACASLPGSSIDHMLPALQELRAHPFEITVNDDAGRPVRMRADPSSLAIVLFGASPAYATVREADAAARAFSAGDRAPLLRLMAEALSSVDSRDASHSPAVFSAGLAAAVLCQDPPQVFDLALEPAQRLAALEREFARVQRTKPDLYAPFTLDEYRGMPPDYAFIDECLQWPAPAAGAPPPPLVAPQGPYPDVPVLVISGELDNMTGVADGQAAASHFPRAQHVVIANSFHVNALTRARSDCGTRLARQFLSQLVISDDRCAARVPPVPLLTRFARTAAELDPARTLPGNQADEAALRQVTAVVRTGQDVLVRAKANGPGRLIGLRGGSFRVEPRGAGFRLTLRQIRWTDDLAVSGRIDWPGSNGIVRARLTTRDATGTSGALALRWRAGDPQAIVTANGQIGGSSVRAAAPLY